MSPWIAVGLALGAQGASAPVLTLEEAVRIAEQNAFRVRIAASDVERQRQRLNEARAAQGPRVTAGATYTRFDREIRQEGGGGESFVIQPIDQKMATLSLALPIDVTGVIGRTIRGASAIVRAAEANRNAERNTIRLSARSAYFNVLRANALVEVSQQAVRNAEEQLRIERAREAAGASARVDVLRFETQLAQAQSELVSAQNQLLLAKQELNNVLARPIQTPFEVQEPGELPSTQGDEDALTAAAVGRRPEVRAIREQRRALELQRRAAEGGLLPSLSAAANVQHNIDPMPAQRDTTTTGTLQLSWPVFDSGLTRARVRQIRQEEEQARLQQEQLELGVSLEVRQAMANLRNATARLQVAENQVRFATETYRLARVRLEAGEGTSLEVTQAQTELTRAQTQLANARYDVRTAFAQLQRAVGADDLGARPAEEGREGTR